MLKPSFINLAKKLFAQVLQIEEDQLEELYDFVNTHFYVEIQDSREFAPSMPRRYSAVLHYIEPGEYGDNLSLMAFGDKDLGGEGIYFTEFLTKEAALEAAYKKINSITFTKGGDDFTTSKFPKNLLILFDKDYHST